ncbi:MAG: hypothetical protein K2W97_04135 [Chthoniobacterales bacterium]|nr:hypothetical protein [Chthoniobacterales bacterium]
MKKTTSLLILTLVMGNCHFLLAQNSSTDVTENSFSSPLMMLSRNPLEESKKKTDQAALERTIQEHERQATDPDNDNADAENQKGLQPRYNINRTGSSQSSTAPKLEITTSNNGRNRNSAFTILNSQSASEFFESRFRNKRARALQTELARVKHAQVVRTQIANKEKWIQFITTITKLGSLLAESKYSFITAAQRFNNNGQPNSTRIENMKRYLSQLKQRIEMADTQHANLTGNDATQIKNNLLSQIDLTKQMLDDLNYNFVIGSGAAGAAGYAIPAAIHAAFCKSAIPLSLICPTAVPFTLAAGTIAAIGSYAYLKEGRNQLYRQSLSEMEAGTARIQALRERNRSSNITVEHTANLTLWLTAELTQFTRTLRANR